MHRTRGTSVPDPRTRAIALLEHGADIAVARDRALELGTTVVGSTVQQLPDGSVIARTTDRRPIRVPAASATRARAAATTPEKVDARTDWERQIDIGRRNIRVARDRGHNTASVPSLRREIHDDGTLGKSMLVWTRVPVATASAARTSRPRGGGRPAPVRRNGRTSRTSSQNPGSDSEEGEPPSPRRLCACGCGRDISHKRADSRTFDQACRKRFSRAVSRAAEGASDQQRWERSLGLSACIAKAEWAMASGDLADSTGRRLVASLVRARQELLGLDVLGAERCQLLHRDCVSHDPDGDAICILCGRLRGKITARVNGFDALDALLRSNRPPAVRYVPGRAT